MKTKLTVSLTNIDKLKSAIENTENKLVELREAIDELEKIELEVQLE